MRLLSVLSALAMFLTGTGAMAQAIPLARESYMAEAGLAALLAIPMEQVFDSEAMLVGSNVEIGSFMRHEVEGVARYIGDCANRFSDDAILKGYCDRAEKYLLTIAPPDGPFGKLFILVRVNTNLVNWSTKNDAAVRAKMLRVAKIEEHWGMAVRYRLRQLEKEKR